MLSMARCEFCKHGKITPTSANMKTLKKHWKHGIAHKLNLEHDRIQQWQRTLTMTQKLNQNENVPKTIGEGKIFEGHITANNGIVKIRLEYV